MNKNNNIMNTNRILELLHLSCDWSLWTAPPAVTSLISSGLVLCEEDIPTVSVLRSHTPSSHPLHSSGDPRDRHTLSALPSLRSSPVLTSSLYCTH